MSQERRTDERASTNLPTRWVGMNDGGAHDAHISDIGLGGCFVNTAPRVNIDEIITLEIQLPSGDWLPLRGEVMSLKPGVGFGLNFTFLTDDEVIALRQFVL
ncbi:MAG TPA: PilZ domain-containing protein [Pyrinomonadaceae bacterium]|jgi:PilZ domain